MARKTSKTKRPPDEDEEQSRRFLDLAAELEAAGELSPTDAGERFARAMDKVAPPKPKRS
jgi:hypothetical protein